MGGSYPRLVNMSTAKTFIDIFFSYLVFNVRHASTSTANEADVARRSKSLSTCQTATATVEVHHVARLVYEARLTLQDCVMVDRPILYVIRGQSNNTPLRSVAKYKRLSRIKATESSRVMERANGESNKSE